jgi:phosphate transport system substrate-binding protein
MSKVFNNMRLTVLLLAILIMNSCTGGPKTLVETPTRGHIKISVDEAYKLLLDTEIYTFEALYKDAKVDVKYRPEVDAITDLMNDSVRLVVVSRDLTKEEKDYLLQKKIIARTTKIAYDGLALIVSKENPDSQLLFDQVKNIFLGRIHNWKEISKNSNLEVINIVFDNPKSGTVRYIKEKFGIKGDLPGNFFAVKSNEEVVNYVQKNRNGLGIIGVNWISDPYDSVTRGFKKMIKVLAIGDAGNIDGSGEFYKPYQAYLAQGVYPLTREAYVVCRESFSGLGTGFASFVAGEKGQRIILKSGLVPATMPVRLVEIKK